MRGSIRIGTIAGIELRVHYNWLLILALVTWSLAQNFFPQSYPGWQRSTYWIIGFIAALLLFASVLLHELAHSFVARARGMPVTSITLFIFGGVSNIAREAERPKTEFAMAIIGPLTSIALAGLFYGLWLVIGNKISPFAAILYYLGFVNAFLAVFNLLPGFPLDGGRVLRSILWGITGNLVKATSVASAVGQGFGWLLIGFGIFQMLTGNLLDGLWMAFIGWFINSAAASSRQETALQEHLKNIQVKAVMNNSVETVSPQVMVSELVEGIFLRYHRRSIPVAEGGKVVGIVTITDVRHVPQERWGQTPVETIMTRQPLHAVSPEDNLTRGMALIAQHDINQVLVLQDGRLMGTLSRADIIGYLQFSQMLGVRSKPRAG